MICMHCGLHQFRKKRVLGRGKMPADILFIGEAPGKSENITGEACTDRSGKLLDEMILDAAPDMKVTYYITYIVQCRPTDSKNGDTRSPAAKEILACCPNFWRIVKKVNPRQVIFIGKIPEYYYHKEFPDAVSIQNTSFLLRQGGKLSSYYTTNIRILTEVFSKWEKS